MRPAGEDRLLLGALLDRLGSIQAQALLARLEQWLSRAGCDASIGNTRFDRDQLRAIGTSYDRRKQITNPNHDLTQGRR